MLECVSWSTIQSRDGYSLGRRRTKCGRLNRGHCDGCECASEEKVLNFVTLNSGYTHRGSRKEASEDALKVCTFLLRELAGPTIRVPVPGQAGYSISGEVERALLCRIWKDEPVADLLVTFAVARKDEESTVLWRRLHYMARSVRPEAPPPKAPWCAVILESGLSRNLEAGEWLMDFERCLAWAWIEFGREKDDDLS